MAKLVGALLAVKLTLGPVWNETTAQHPVEVELPAGSVPPGRAEITLRSEASQRLNHVLSFDMPASGAVRLRLWLDPLGGIPASRKVDVAVRSQTGREFRERAVVDPVFQTRRSDILFAATSGELEAFDRALRGATVASDASELLSAIHVVGREALAPLGCRSLVDSAMVVTRSGSDEDRDLLECAAKGARVLFVGSPPAPLVGLQPGRAWYFGLGNVAYAADFNRTSVDAALDLTKMGAGRGLPRPQGLGQQLLEIARNTPMGRPIPARGAILAVLAAYVALIGPIGWLVALRSRRTVVQWAWFPCVSLGTIAIFTVIGASSYAETAKFTLTHLSVDAPGYGGLLRGSLRLSGLDAETCRISMPWHGADLTEVGRPYRFGSPFRQPAGGIEFLEDGRSGRLEVRGLVVERYGLASLGYVAPIAPRSTARAVLLRSGGVRVENQSDVTLKRTLVVLDNGAWADVGRLSPGQSRRVTPSRSNPRLPEPAAWRDRDYRNELQASQFFEYVPAGHFLIASDVEAPKPKDTRSVPALPTDMDDVRLVVGPLGEVAE